MPSIIEAKDKELTYKFYRLDINKNLAEILELINKFKPCIIYNFAAQGMVEPSWDNPYEWYETNFLSPSKLVNNLLQSDYLEKFVQISTPEVYGNTGGDKLRENNIYNPSTPYALSKASLDKHLELMQKEKGFPVIFTRSANIYGVGQQLYRIIPKTILCAKAGRVLTLNGGGKSIRSFINIKDVIDATILLGRKAAPGTYWHITTEDQVTIKELIINICKILDVHYESIVKIGKERTGNDKNYFLCGRNLSEEFHWTRRIELQEGIANTIYWIEKNYERFKNMPWVYEHKK